jgi:hypothetical protein
VKVDVLETSFDRPAMWRLQPGRNAVRLDIPNQLRNARAVFSQVVAIYRGKDDFFSSPVEHPAAARTAAFPLDQRHHRSPGSEQLDKAECSCSTDFEFGSKL